MPFVNKKNGGVIKNWQIHTVSNDIVQAKRVFPEINFGVNKTMVFTGTVVVDYAERWPAGNHMRSSLIVEYDPDTGRVETLNTYYLLSGPKGDHMLGCVDLRGLVMSIFY